MTTIKEAMKDMTKLEIGMVILRDLACLGLIILAVLNIFEIVHSSTPVAFLLPVICVSQAVLSWKRSRITALFFLGGILFFLFVLFVSKG